MVSEAAHVCGAHWERCVLISSGSFFVGVFFCFCFVAIVVDPFVLCPLHNHFHRFRFFASADEFIWAHEMLTKAVQRVVKSYNDIEREQKINKQ